MNLTRFQVESLVDRDLNKNKPFELHFLKGDVNMILFIIRFPLLSESIKYIVELYFLDLVAGLIKGIPPTMK